MKLIKNAKDGVLKLAAAARCRLQIATAVMAQIACEKRLQRLHPVRDAVKRERLAYKVRSSAVWLELATAKMTTI